MEDFTMLGIGSFVSTIEFTMLGLTVVVDVPVSAIEMHYTIPAQSQHFVVPAQSQHYTVPNQ